MSKEKSEEEMEKGKKDESVYGPTGREKLVEDDEMEPFEQGFMEGATKAGQLGKDALTGESLMDIENVVEAEIDGKVYRFVSKENAEKFRQKKAKE